MSDPVRPLEERFWERVEFDTNGGCWLWSGSTGSCGYGALKVGGATIRAHRVSYALHNGPIPAGDGYHGTCVLHRCDVRACVNPAHLFLGTQGENSADMARKGRAVANVMPGEQHPRAKLTPQIVLAIRRGTENQREVAARYGVHQVTVSKIRLGKVWTHIVDQEAAPCAR